MQSLPGTLDATYGGGEANVCASLAMLGTPSRYLTALPPNPVAQAFAAELRGLGVDVGRITWNPKGRMGVYYAEHGAGTARFERGLRPAKAPRFLCSDRRTTTSPRCLTASDIFTSPALLRRSAKTPSHRRSHWLKPRRNAAS